MHTKRKLALIILFLFLASGAAVSAQTGERWARLSNVSAGTKLIVDQENGAVVKGKFVRVTDSSIVLRARGGEVELQRDSVAAVHSSRQSSRLKRGLIGALAGAGAGIAIGVAAVTLGKSDPLIAAGGLLVGIPVGAVVGAATASTKKGDLLYSR